jgi:amidase
MVICLYSARCHAQPPTCSTALDVLAGPDERESIAYRLTLPPSRHYALKDFRVLVIDSNPYLATSGAARDALDRLSDRLMKAGVKVGRETSLLPDPAETRRTYLLLLHSFISCGRPAEFYGGIFGRAATG